MPAEWDPAFRAVAVTDKLTILARIRVPGGGPTPGTDRRPGVSC